MRVVLSPVKAFTSVVISRCLIPIADVRSLHLHPRVCLHEPIPLFDLPRSLELGPPLALAHLEPAPLLTGLRVPPLILLGVHLSGAGMLELRPPSLRRAVSGDAAARTGLNLRRDLAALILAVVMIVLTVLRLGSIDQRLLFVTGFEPAAKTFKYRVNQHFGAASGSLNPFRTPFVVSIQARMTLSGGKKS